jgi:hypothetical protein
MENSKTLESGQGFPRKKNKRNPATNVSFKVILQSESRDKGFRPSAATPHFLFKYQ